MATAATKGQTTVDPYSDEGWAEAPQEALIKFDTVGDVFRGRIVGFGETENGVPQVHFDSPDHGLCFINAGKDLQRQIKAIGAKTGWFLRITLTGLQPVRERESNLMLFKVEYKRP